MTQVRCPLEMSGGTRGASIQVMSAQVGGYPETQPLKGSQLEEDKFMETLRLQQVLKVSVSKGNGINIKCPILIVAGINSKISFTMHLPGSRHSTIHFIYVFYIWSSK